MKEKWEEFRGTLSDTETMSKKEFLLTIAVCILGGIVFGMLFSPRKSTMIASNNGNNNGGKSKDNANEETDNIDEIADWDDEE